ncbi:MAG: alanine--tRNA ligase [Bdellovibrionales bacterium]|nr:alanine--tRNA ligase [Bdellovibrionales bacterium]
MKTAEIRERFLKYFERNGHTIVESSSLVPSNDPSLLFTTAGMVQFKDVFLGKDKRPYTRATTAQKCVRAGGKHNDLENVGFTARHHTFFEMLGNFSFGDYFKKDAIHFAWEFITKELGFPKDKLYVTVFETDDEAADIWHKQEGVAKDRIYRLGEKDNFWSMGDTGPCGPCTEIYYDRGPKYGRDGFIESQKADEDRYMEFWNLVFMQYDRDAKGVMNPLPKPSVDTGAGLERIAAIAQNADTNYDTDAFQHIIGETSKLAGVEYVRSSDLAPSFRVIADHSRATAFLVSDGVLPSNEGRGYVLRRIMRRAIRHGKKLGLDKPFLHKTCGFVVDQMKEAYPNLQTQRAFIERAVLAEEEQFFKTLDKGLALLDDEIGKISTKTLPGEVAFKLYDTFGFPLDLTRVIATERGIAVDEKGFETAMAKQRADSRKSWKGSGAEALDAVYLQLATDLKAKKKMPEFVGYDSLTAEGEVLAILKQGDQKIELVNEVAASSLALTADSADSAIVEVVFSKTPFYGESGGQVGDKGRVVGIGSDLEAEVIDVQKPVPDLIVAHLRIRKGALKVGAKVRQDTDRELRALTTANHTATHLLHWALRKHLGDHVKQAGSIVTPDLLRFDFSHFEALKPSDLRTIEDLINEKIWKNDGVTKRLMAKEAAIQAGAIAMFGEKYGDTVRVVSVGDFSTELCGGCHVDQSGDIHLFKIVSETSIAAGVRRLIAYTSKGAYEFLRARNDMLAGVKDAIKAQTIEEIPVKLDRMSDGEKALRKQLEQVLAKAAAGEADALFSGAQSLAGGKLIAGMVELDSQGAKKLRDLAESLKNRAADGVIVLGMKDGEKANLIVAIGKDAQKKWNANEVLKQLAPLIEGRGGGKPDLAQAGGTKTAGLAEALKSAAALLAK